MAQIEWRYSVLKTLDLYCQILATPNHWLESPIGREINVTMTFLTLMVFIE